MEPITVSFRISNDGRFPGFCSTVVEKDAEGHYVCEMTIEDMVGQIEVMATGKSNSFLAHLKYLWGFLAEKHMGH